jgi:hypothetical protein
MFHEFSIIVLYKGHEARSPNRQQAKTRGGAMRACLLSILGNLPGAGSVLRRLISSAWGGDRCLAVKLLGRPRSKQAMHATGDATLE